MSTEQERQEWARLAEAATPGEWVARSYDRLVTDDESAIAQGWENVGTIDSEDDLAFIAASRAAVPALLADVDRLTGDNAVLGEALDTALLHLKESEADRDKAIAELASYKRNAAYIAACVDSDGCYKP
jgi:hypothetical protein